MSENTQKREGRVNKKHVKAIAESSGRTEQAVYDVLWAAADLGYEFNLPGAQPVTIDRDASLLANLIAAGDWLRSEELKVRTWRSPILRKQLIRARYINKVDDIVDAHLNGTPA